MSTSEITESVHVPLTVSIQSGDAKLAVTFYESQAKLESNMPPEDINTVLDELVRFSGLAKSYFDKEDKQAYQEH